MKRITGATLAILAGLVFTGSLPGTAVVAGTVFTLALVVALFDGDPLRALDIVTKTAGRVSAAVKATVEDVTEDVA